MSKADFDTTKVEFTPDNLSNPELMFKVYTQFCRGMAKIATNGHLKPRVANYHWVDFDKLTEDRYCHLQEPIDCEFGKIWSVMYFRYQLSIRISNGDIYDEMTIDLRDDVFKDVALIKSRRDVCNHQDHTRKLYWEEGGGGAFMEDGTPFHAVLCEHCLAFKYTGKTALKVKGYGLVGKLFGRFR
ncbi:hypothetical protein MYOV003v1_p0042 [Vibrio phage 207E48.1]|nr:hypothetical protein MYOV003v1_p0042 [Vibrio phage 207E48.1]